MRLSPAKYIARKNAPDGGAATPHATEGVHMPTPEKEDMMTDPTPPQPVLPLADEARLAIRNMRFIASNMRQSDDSIVAGDAFALEDLADALERSLGGAA